MINQSCENLSLNNSITHISLSNNSPLNMKKWAGRHGAQE